MSILILFGLILVAGVCGGEIAHRTRFFPRITGYIFVGFFLGPHLSGILTQNLLDHAKIFTQLATGLVLFQLGLKTNVQFIWRNKILAWMGACESILTFILLFSTLFLFHIPVLQAAIAAAIGVSSSPAVTMMIANEYNIKGPVTESSLALTAINNILAFCFFIMILPFLHLSLSGQTNILYALPEPLYRICGSLSLAFLVSLALVGLGHFVGKIENIQFALISGVLVLTIGLAKTLNISMLFTMLMLGIFLTLFDRKKVLMEIEFGRLGEIFFVLLFVIAGTHLHLGLLIDFGFMAIAFVLARLLAKMLPIFFLSRKRGFTSKQSSALGLTLIPMASMAIGLVNTTFSISGEFASGVAAVIFAAIAILETVGPIVTVFALKMAGEIAPEKKISH